MFPLPQADLPRKLCDGNVKLGVTIGHCNEAPDFQNPAVRAFRHLVLAHQFRAVHLGFEAASAILSALPLSGRSTTTSAMHQSPNASRWLRRS